MPVVRLRIALAAALVLLAAVVAGCRTTGDAAGPAPGRVELVPDDGGAFTVAENMLDTWNTIGKVVVAMDGVEYEGRSQMLGVYTLRYRGERFLVRTKAVPITPDVQSIRTRVDAVDGQGKPYLSLAAATLLAVLEQRVPVEVVKYRQPIKTKPDKPVKKKNKAASKKK